MQRFTIAGGDAGIAETVRMMQSIVFGREGVGSPQVRGAAISAVRGQQRGIDEIHAVFNWVKDNIEFRGEYAETLQTPVITLQLGAGDCDDHTTLLAAMYESLGFETRFNTVAVGKSNEYSHVFLEVKERVSGQWLPVDTTVGSSYPGWKPDNIRRQRIRSAGARPTGDDDALGKLLLVAVGLALAKFWKG